MWDVFICHASEDKDEVARPLARLLESRGYRVWLDEQSLRLGDSLRQKIDEGLARSRYGVVILSPAFLEKEWPQRELDGLFARELNSGKVILPVWHELNAEEVAARVPTIAGRIAVRTSEGLETVARRIADVLGNPGKPGDEEPVRGTLVYVGPPDEELDCDSIVFLVRDGERPLWCRVPCLDIKKVWGVVGRKAQIAGVTARKETIMGLAQRAYDAGEAIDGDILVVRLEGSD